MRVIALLATYNEERFVANCLEHLLGQGVQVYLVDNGSTDRTLEVAQRYLGRGLVAIESMTRSGLFDLKRILRRKEELASELDADWFIHLDADEIRLPPRSGSTLAEALEEADKAGYNAVNFQEYTFIPTVESPDHDHQRYEESMLCYYPFAPFSPHRLNAWKRQDARVDLCSSAGHVVKFPGRSISPLTFLLRHYIFLSVEHALEKYGRRRHPSAALDSGWHTWREGLEISSISLPSAKTLRHYTGDDRLDCSQPLARHPFVIASTAVAARQA